MGVQGAEKIVPGRPVCIGVEKLPEVCAHLFQQFGLCGVKARPLLQPLGDIVRKRIGVESGRFIRVGLLADGRIHGRSRTPPLQRLADAIAHLDQPLRIGGNGLVPHCRTQDCAAAGVEKVTAAEQRAARRRARRRADERVPEYHAFDRNSVHIRRLEQVIGTRTTVDCGIVPGESPPVVGEEKEDIPAGRRVVVRLLGRDAPPGEQPP